MHSSTYVIEFEGTIPAPARDEFADFVLLEDATSTRLVGQVDDQAALHGVLDRLNSLGLSLIEVSLRTPTGSPNGTRIDQHVGESVTA